MNDLEQLSYTADLRIPKAGDTVYIKFKNQPYREERLVEKISSGGEGNIFSTEHYGSMVIKLYHPEKLTPGRVEKITALSEEIYDVNSEVFDYICWPKATVFDYAEGNMIGYLMEKVPADAIPLSEIISQMALSNSPANYTRHDLTELCRRIAERFALLHNLAQKRLLMCDVNPTNILISPDLKQVYFVDLDSYQYESISGKLLRCPVGRDVYTSPALYERMRSHNTASYADVNRTESDEGFAVAVLYFSILMLGREPFDRYGESYEDVIRQGKFTFRDGHPPCYIWNNLTPTLKQMFKDIFIHQKTHNDNDWIGAFARMQKDIEDLRLSDALRPDTYPMSSTDRIMRLQCKKCNKAFIGSQEFYREYYPYCHKCLLEINLAEKNCKKVVCSVCGQKFTTNGADNSLEGNRAFSCPDCDPDHYFLRKKIFEEQQSSSHELVALAMKNLEES